MFQLVTRHAVLDVVQGTTHNVTRADLYTVDADTSPCDIRYEITIPPGNGRMVLNWEPTQPITEFTQQDVDDSVVQFIHDGSTRSGVLYFKVK